MTFRETIRRRDRETVPFHEHDGSDISGEIVASVIKAEQFLGGIMTGKEFIVAGGTDGIIRSDNFVSGSAGWRIRGDGNAEFHDVLIRGDIESGNWDGASPANLATFDATATVGFYLDSSVGAGQFSGNLFVGGKIIATDGTESIEIDPTGWGSTQVTIKLIVGAASQDPEITGSLTNGILFLKGGGAVNNTQIKVAGAIPRIDFEVDGADRMKISTTRVELADVDFLKLPVKTTTGDPASPVDGDMYLNTFDNVLRLRADAAWRTVFSY